MNSYQISRVGQVLGTFDEAQIREGLRNGTFQPSDWCWQEGMSEWQGLPVRFQPEPQTTALPPAAQPTFQPPAAQPTLQHYQPLVLPQWESPQSPTLEPKPAAEINPYAAPRSNVSRFVKQKAPETASRGSRLGAYFLDCFVFCLSGVPAALVNPGPRTSGSSSTDGMLVVAAVLLLVGLNIYLVISRGQTIGKKMVGIRVADMDGEKADAFKILVMRGILGQGLLGIIPLYSLIDPLMIFNTDKRCLHDKVAGTQVVRVEAA